MKLMATMVLVRETKGALLYENSNLEKGGLTSIYIRKQYATRPWPNRICVTVDDSHPTEEGEVN